MTRFLTGLQTRRCTDEKLAGPGCQGSLQRTPRHVLEGRSPVGDQAWSRHGCARSGAGVVSATAIRSPNPQGAASGSDAALGHAIAAARPLAPSPPRKSRLMQSYLLDTNVISELRRARPHGAVLQWLKGV